MHRFTGKLETMQSSVFGHHCVIPEAICQEYLQQKITRLICTINDEYSWHCAILSMGNGTHYILMNKELVKRFGWNLNDEFDVAIQVDESKYGMFCPEEMEALLEQDDDGSAYFHALTPGKQRGLLHIIGKPKSSQKRLEKAVVILEYLKNSSGVLDYKLLNQAFKDYRGMI